MTARYLLLSLSLLCSATSFAFAVRNDDPHIIRSPNGYLLRSGDVIRLEVLGEPECLVEQQISSEDRVRLRYIGELPITNMTVKQAQTYVAQEYRRRQIFKDATILISIKKHKPRYVYLNGYFNKTGPFALPPEVEAMEVVRLINSAGGFKETAQTKRVYVTRTHYDTNGKVKETKTYELNVKDRMEGSIDGQNHKPYMIYPGDQLKVGERII